MCQIQCYPSGLPGSGVGKGGGGGGGGAVRESGGGLGQFGAAQEEGYFFKKQLEQLKKIKKKLDSGESLKISQKEKDDKMQENDSETNGVSSFAIKDCGFPQPGSGVGKGGGGGGSIRESGGSLGEYGTSQEDGYFYKKQREQLEKIKGKKTKEKGTTDPAESSNKLKEKDDK
ncbi:unnamed protein product, partial [Iphiclides podalirius]